MLCLQLFTSSINHFSSKGPTPSFCIDVLHWFWGNYFLELYLTTQDRKLVLFIMLIVLGIKLVHIILWGDWGIEFEFSAIFYAQGEQFVLWLFPGQLISLFILLCVWPLCFNMLYFYPFLFVPQHLFRAFSKCYVCTCLQDKLSLMAWKAELLYLLSCSMK